MLWYFAASASTSIFWLAVVAIIGTSITSNSGARWCLFSILLNEVIVVYIASWVLHCSEIIVSALISLSLALIILSIMTRSVSLSNSCFFSVCLGYDSQWSISFVVSIIDLLFLSCHEILFFISIIIHVSVKILWLSLRSHLIIRVDIIIYLSFNLLVGHCWRIFPCTNTPALNS